MGKALDLLGRKFGRLTVRSQRPERGKHKEILWECLCDCGNVTNVATGSLTSSNTTSCGCFHKERVAVQGNKNVNSLIGNRFTRLLVIGMNPVREKDGHVRWDCNCDCGNQHTVASNNLIAGSTVSCGCHIREKSSEVHRDRIHHESIKHGLSDSPEYQVWLGLKRRCFNESDSRWDRYGGRGITVCDRWLGSSGFENFYSDLGSRPSDEHSIERRNNDGDYEPNNCYWATAVEQANNTSRNVFYDFRGQKLTISQIARMFKVDYGRLSYNSKKFNSIEEALSETIDKARSKF